VKNNIKKLREELGWSQEKLARAAGTSGPQINRLEKSQRRLTQEWMMKLADALGCHPSDLLPPYANDEKKSAETPRRLFLRDSAGAETVPVLGQDGSKAGALVINEKEEVGRVAAHPQQAGVRRAFAFYTRGESMAPRYRSGELVYVVSNRPPVEGQDCLIELRTGDACLRQFLRQTEGKLVYRQLNPEKEFRRDLSEIKALHTVVGRG
jgi:phage repressor protein C with HTH and peptisase S24 domain